MKTNTLFFRVHQKAITAKLRSKNQIGNFESLKVSRPEPDNQG